MGRNKNRLIRSAILMSTALLVAGLLAAGAAPVGTAFTYQGRLVENGVGATGTCDFEFSLWDAADGPNPLGSTQTVSGVTVTGGLFTVTLNGGGEFGPNAFDGDRRWLEIAACCPSPCGAFTTLSPRQEVTPAPYSLHALSVASVPWSELTGVPAGFADDIDDDTPPNMLSTILIEAAGSKEVCVECPADHPFMMGGACEKGAGGLRGFGPSTRIDTTTYCCEDIGAANSVIVTAICA